MWPWIISAIHFIGDALAVIGHALVVALKWFAVHVWIVLRWLGDHVASLAKTVWGGLQKLWNEILPDIARKIASVASTVTTFIRDHFGWLLSAIHKITSAVNFIYSNIIKPIFQVIDFFRAIFRVLGDLGVGWAKAVDVWLGNLEMKIWDAFNTVRSWINHVLGILAYLLDPFGMLRRGHMLGALGRDLAHLVALFPHVQIKPNLGTQAQLTAAPRRSFTARVQQFRDTGLLDDPGVKAAVDNFDSYSSEARG